MFELFHEKVSRAPIIAASNNRSRSSKFVWRVIYLHRASPLLPLLVSFLSCHFYQPLSIHPSIHLNIYHSVPPLLTLSLLPCHSLVSSIHPIPSRVSFIPFMQLSRAASLRGMHDEAIVLQLERTNETETNE